MHALVDGGTLGGLQYKLRYFTALYANDLLATNEETASKESWFNHYEALRSNLSFPRIFSAKTRAERTAKRCQSARVSIDLSGFADGDHLS